MFKFTALALTALSIAAGPASALSCMRATPEQRYAAAASAKQSFVVLHGTFAFNRKALPVKKGRPTGGKVKAQFRGKSLSRRGFAKSYSGPVTVALQCAGPWCASLTPNTPYVAIVSKGKGGLTFSVGPCYGNAFKNPDAATLRAFERCAKGGKC